jgi:hypothetical protein
MLVFMPIYTDISVVSKRQIANPKAVASQVEKSKALEVDYHESGIWRHFASLFENQYEILPLSFEFCMPTIEKYIFFPYLIRSEVEKGSCGVWIEQQTTRRRVRHIRLCRSEAEARADENFIRTIMNQHFPGGR